MKSRSQNIIIVTIFIILQFSCKDKVSYSVDAEISDEMRTDIIKQQIIELPKGVYFPSMELFDGETLTLRYVSSGCFHYMSETVRIKRQNNNYSLSASKYSGGNEIQIISDSLMQPSFVSILSRFSNYCKLNIMEKLKDPSNENYFSTSSKGIFLKIRNDSLWVPIKDLNSHYSLIEEFTNQNQFPIKVNGS